MSVIGKIVMMEGKLFFNNVPPSEIDSMSYTSKKYWYNHCLSIKQGYQNAANEVNNA